jgi:hypothetical protein
MATIYDFSKALVHCSGIYFVVADGKTKTGKQKYEECFNLLVEENTKYNEMGERKQNMANGLKKAAKIAGLEYMLDKLEATKHEDPLPAGAKSYLKRVYGQLKYGKWSATQEKGNKYTQKGKLGENDSIALINALDGFDLVKNEIRVENKWITGVADAFLGENIHEAEYIIDVKTSWDWDSFAANIGSALNPLYWWQIQGYMELTGAKAGEVSYCLINTPDVIIQQELLNLARRMDVISIESPAFKAAEKELINNLTFDNIPAPERRLKFFVEKSEEAAQKIRETIPKCREYLMELQEMHLTGVFTDKELPILETIEEI